MRELVLPSELLEQEPSREGHKNTGQDCWLAHSPELEAALAAEFGRPGLCLKIFRGRPGLYGGVPIAETAKVQNLFAFAGIAPRVYGIVAVNGRTAEVCDYAIGEGEPNVALARQLLSAYNLGLEGYKDAAGQAQRYVAMGFKWVGGWFVDFGRFRFLDPKGYAENLRKRCMHRRSRLTGERVGYQAVPELHIPGQRNQAHRLRHMRLADYDWQGKTVLDLGCNLGAMCREAVDRGARRVVGVDFKRCSLWREVNNWLGYWTIDFLELTLPDQAGRIRELSGIERFDAVFALAIVQHMQGDYQSWIADLAGEVLWLEGTWNAKPEQYRPLLERDFPDVELIGYIRDEDSKRKPDRRPLFRGWRIPRPEPEPLPEGGTERREAAVYRGLSVRGRVMLRRETLGLLYDTAARAPDGAAVEIGALDGSATCCWAAAREGRGEMLAIELAERSELERNLGHYGYQVEVWRGDSAKAAAPEGLAWVFVDGDHSLTGVQADIERFVMRLVPGGIVVFDDAVDKPERGVELAVADWRRKHGWPLVGTCDRAAAYQRPMEE